jgi:hypothetical protein
VVASGQVTTSGGRVDDRRGGRVRPRLTGAAVSEDWYVEAVDEVTSAADRLHTSLGRLVQLLEIARRRRLAGEDLLEIVRPLVDVTGRDVRRAPSADYKNFEQVLTAYRARTIRALIDDEGMNFSSVGLLIGLSRQMVARLYRAAGPAAASQEERHASQ